jgi:hypothetical protein
MNFTITQKETPSGASIRLGAIETSKIGQDDDAVGKAAGGNIACPDRPVKRKKEEKQPLVDRPFLLLLIGRRQ